MYWRTLLIYLILLISISTVYTQDNRVVIPADATNTSFDQIKITQFDLLKDTSCELTIDDVIDHPQFNKGILRNDRLILKRGATYWVRYTLINESERDLLWYQNFPTIDFYYLHTYLVDEKKRIYGIDTIGSLVDFKSRLVQTKELTFPLELAPCSIQEVYHYLDRRYMDVGTKMYLEAPNRQIARAEEYGVNFSITTGVAYGYIFIAVLLCLIFRNWEFFYFLIYVVGYGLFIFYQHGYGVYAIWGNGALKFFYDCAPFVGFGFAAIGFFGVFRYLFKLKQNAYKVDTFFRVVSMIIIFLIGCLIAWRQITQFHPEAYDLTFKLLALVTTIGLVLLLCTGVYISYRQRHREHILYLLTFLPVMLMTFLALIMEFDPAWRIDHFINVGPAGVLLYESLVLSTLLIFRVYQERNQYTLALQEERTEIKYDIHSGIQPNITVLKNLINSPKTRSPLQQKILTIADEIEEDLLLLRDILASQRMRYLDGLVAKIREKARARFQHTHIEYEVITKPLVIPSHIELPFKVLYHFYYFTKEAINNVARHSQASFCSIQMTYTQNELFLLIKDNGVGINFSEAEEKNRTGLLELEERARKMGAIKQYKLTSSPGHGTTIELKVSLSFVNTLDRNLL